jgi:hypothetical protein
MSPLVTSSDRFLFWCFLSIVLIPAAPASGKVLLTTDEALSLAFPDCTPERRTVYLTAAQVERAQKLAGAQLPTAIIYPYVASRGETRVGTAYFDRHQVRSLTETLMVVIDSADTVARVEVLAFNEPESYLPRAAWYRQFLGRRLDPGLVLERSIRGITGATLTARATTQAVRRVLAVHQILELDGGLDVQPGHETERSR